MSLDVYLKIEKPILKKSSGVFVRENGQTIEISQEEWNERFPDKEPVRVNTEQGETNYVFEYNITHNLNTMAEKAGIYQHLWRPEELNISYAKDLIEPLRNGLKKLLDNPDYFKTFNPDNGWGDYSGLLRFVEEYLEACIEYPESIISVSR